MATEETTISELEFTEELAPDNLIPVESQTDTKATSLQILKNWLSSFFVRKTGTEKIGGVKIFDDTTYFAKNGRNIVLQGGDGGAELGEIIFEGNNDYPNKTNLDRYEDCLRIFGEHNQEKEYAVLTNKRISKAENGYVKLGNGIIIQWGFNALPYNPTTITLPTAFTSTNYSIAIAGLMDKAYNDFGCRLHNLTTTSFQAYRAAALKGMKWIAIGY